MTRLDRPRNHRKRAAGDVEAVEVSPGPGQDPETHLMCRPPAARSALFLFLVTTLGATAASAAPPQIKGIEPLGVRRGEATEVTVSGANLAANPRLIAPFGFTVESPAPGGSNA